MASHSNRKSDEDFRKRKRPDFDLELEESPVRENSGRRFTRSSLSSPTRSEYGGSSRQNVMSSDYRQPPPGNRRRMADPIPARLPRRLFPEGLVPGAGRVNSYSHPEYLFALRDVLEGTEEFEYIKESSLGKLFEIQTRKAALSGKLVHQFLCRSLVTRKRHEIWYVFGGKPIRYGLKEFGYLTGLNCDPYPPEDEMESLRKDCVGPKSFWRRLIGQREHCLVTDIIDMLRYDRQRPPEERMSAGRRLRLALVVIVEGILIPTSSTGRASREVVEQVKDVQRFLDYPWGRRSFELTLEMVTYGNQFNPTVRVLRDKLSSSHLTIHGFTLAFQLHILTTVPKVCELLPDKAVWLSNFLEPSVEALPKFRSFHNDNIRRIESDRELQVISILGFGFPLESNDFSWADEVEDRSVDQLLQMLQDGHKFRREEWVAGDIDNEEVDPPAVEVRAVEVRERRQNVLGIPKTKQGTIRKLLAGKGKEVSKGKDKGKGVVVDVEDESSDSSDEDEYYLAKRMKIIEVLDLVLAEIKSERYGKKGVRSKTDKKSRPINTGKGSGIVISEGHHNSEKLVSSVSGGSAAPKAASDGNSAKQFICPARSSVEANEAYGMVGEVLADLAKDQQIDNPKMTDEGWKTKETGGPSVVIEEERKGEAAEVMSPAREASVVVPVNDGQEKAEEKDKNFDEGTTETLTKETLEKMDFETALEMQRELDPALVEDTGVAVEGEAVKEATNCQEDDLLWMEGDEAEQEIERETAELEMEMTDNEDDKDDEKPLRSKRERKVPQKFGQEDSLSSCEDSGIAENLKKQFMAKLSAYRKSEYTVNGHKQPKSFYKDIYKPRSHTNTEHINAMLCCVWRRLSSYLVERRVVILDAWFTELLVKDHGRYVKKRKGESSFIWNNTLRKYVVGEVDNRTGRLGWLVDIDEVYAPMDIGHNHWVAICIELKNGVVVVYDCNIDGNTDAKLTKAIKPVTEILPVLIEEVALTSEAAYTPPATFVHERPTDVYQTKISGDSGPLSVKFIEERAQGLSVDGFTDKSVESIRLMYAMEAYSEFQEPLSF